ncbi:MAG: lamin tail domain-containing protein [Flavobacteriales bacterium]|nr:lamin tail domain-containing protein [Flavobacteriales bacterium]
MTSSAQLRLTNSGTDTAFIVTANNFFGATEWSFWFRLAFAPSSQNYLMVYLSADNPTLDGPVNGYYIRYGETGSADGLELWKQSGTTHTRIIDGASNPNAASTNQQIRCRVRRNAVGNWEIFADYTGGLNLASVGTTTDATTFPVNYLGVACVHTSSNSDKFYLDDVYCGPWIIDTQPPQIQMVTATSPTTLDILFNEPIQSGPAALTSNFLVNQGIGQPTSAQLSTSNPALVQLTLGSSLTTGITYSILVSGQTDLSGNVMSPASVSFLYYVGGPFDVLIHEIMADPTPVVGLPAYEYVELFNTRSFDIDLSNWKLKSGSITKTIPSGTILKADSFLVLTDASAISQFANLPVSGITSFPSISNSGTTVQLLTPDGRWVHDVRFDLSWYGNPAKDDGGWSLEMRNPTEPCVLKSNWTASQHPDGGTPGRRNSVYQNVPVPLTFQNVLCDDSVTLRLVFNKRLDTLGFGLSNFSLQPALPLAALPYRGQGDTIILVLSQPLTPNQIYTLSFNGPVTLCNGGAFSGSISATFVLPVIRPFDVLITEIMADESPSVNLPLLEYLELYNFTSYPVNLTGWSLTAGSTTRIFSGGIIPPDSFVIVTQPLGVDLFTTGLVAPLANFPSISNEGTTLSLRDPSGKIIHSVSYTDKWYQDPGKNNGGWSLEMIDPTTPCLGKSNWRASRAPDGGTPGYRNSVWRKGTDATPPFLKFVGAPKADTLLVYFSEGLHPALAGPQHFLLPNSGVSVVSVEPLYPDYSILRLGLDHYLQTETSYYLVVTDTLPDCARITTGKFDTLQFQLPKPPLPGQIVLNEILFNPRGAGSEYTEIFNRSDKYLELRGLKLCKADSTTQTLTSIKETAGFSLILQPGRYLVFTDNGANVQSEYPGSVPRNFLEISSNIDVSNSGGTVAITDPSFNILDMLSFDESWHYQVIKNPDGVSLERINPHQPTQWRSNWNSAAATENYGTPGYQNSQFMNAPADDAAMSLYPDIFSPDNDGYNDVLLISFNLEKGGYIASVLVFDEAGRQVQTLARNLLLPPQATLSWNGQDAQGAKCRVGYYIIWAELFHEDGSKKRFRKAAVLASRLD